MTPPISSLMQRQINVVDMERTLAQIEVLFAERGLSWAPVVEPDGEIVGVVSAADLMRVRARDPNAARIPAWQLCTYKPISVDAATPIAEVARQMVARHVHHVVVTEDGHVAGIVSSLDFVRRFCA